MEQVCFGSSDASYSVEQNVMDKLDGWLAGWCGSVVGTIAPSCGEWRSHDDDVVSEETRGLLFTERNKVVCVHTDE